MVRSVSQRAPLFLAADRVHSHDRTATEHQEEQKRGKDQPQECTSLAFRRRDVLRLQLAQPVRIDSKAVGEVHAVTMLPSYLFQALAQSLHRRA